MNNRQNGFISIYRRLNRVSNVLAKCSIYIVPFINIIGRIPYVNVKKAIESASIHINIILNFSPPAHSQSAAIPFRNIVENCAMS